MSESMVLSSDYILFSFPEIGISLSKYSAPAPPTPPHATLTTGLHPGKGLSQPAPAAPGLEDGRGQDVILMCPETVSYHHTLLVPNNCRDDGVTSRVSPGMLPPY